MGDSRVMERYRSPAFRGDRASLEQQVNQKSMIVHARGDNPLCGDMIEMTLALGEGPNGGVVIERACWDGYGCSLCIASAETLLERVQSCLLSEARAIEMDEILHLLGDPVVSRSRLDCVHLPHKVFASLIAPYR